MFECIMCMLVAASVMLRVMVGRMRWVRFIGNGLLLPEFCDGSYLRVTVKM